MFEVKKEDRIKLYDLFKEVPVWKAFIDSAILDGYGIVKTDSLSNPAVAVLFYGGIVIYGGDADSPFAEEIIKEFNIQPAVLGYSSKWNKLLISQYKNIINKQTRYHLPFHSHNFDNITTIRNENRYHIEPIVNSDFDLLQESLEWEHHKYHYANVDDFVSNGLGSVIRENGKIISGASAYCMSKKYAECQVNTSINYRKKGYATAIGAEFVNRCYQNNIEIPWDAANKASVELGKKLGYTEVSEYEIFEIFQ